MTSHHHVPSATLPLPTPIQNGGSRPGVLDFDDQVIRLVKWHPSSQGATCTLSELAASRLGQLIGAPIVRGLVVHIPTPLLPSGLANPQPFHLGFTYLRGNNFRAPDYASIKNKAALPAAAAQLCWLRVGDQEGHNQYLWNAEDVLPDSTTRRTNHFILIDQAHIFGTTDWTGQNLGNGQEAYNLPTHLKAQLSIADIDSAVQAVEAISEEDLIQCFGCPEEWSLPADLAEKAAQYLLARRQHMRSLLEAALQ